MFILISTTNGHIEEPMFFATHEQARNQIKEELAKVLEIDVSKLDEFKHDNCKSNLTKDSAFYTNSNGTINWQIFQFDYKNLFTVAQINEAVKVLRRCAFDKDARDTVMEIIKVFTGE